VAYMIACGMVVISLGNLSFFALMRREMS